MSEKGIINNALHRPLTGGNSFNKYIPSSTCETVRIGAGDTYFGMEGIKDFILKYYKQTSKLAPKLQKKTLPATITAIYDFEYNHIQYKADGAAQNLRGPACSWHVRKEGIDCKSYSIFTGCILASLGIKFYIRKIKQPGMLPNEYTHVYIVVPKDQKTGSLNGGYYVIDATKHTNTEAAYIAKYDIFMDKLEYFGLSAPANCATTAGTVKGNFAPVTEEAKQGFRDFLNFLQKVGIDPRVICEIRKTIQDYLNKGVDPEFGIAREGVVIEGRLIKFAYPEVHGPKTYKSPLALAYYIANEASGGLKGNDPPPPTGGGGQTGNGGSGNSGSGNGEWFGELGEEVGTVAMESLMSSGWWDRTFGAIFSNGFMIGCFGTSNSPSQSTKEVRLDAQEFYKASGIGDLSRGGFNTENFQKFVDVCSAYIAHREFGKSNGDLARCTRKGNEVGYEMMKKVLNEITTNATRIARETGGYVVTEGAKELKNYQYYPIPSGYLNSSGGLHDDPRFVTKSTKYKVVAPVPIVVPPPTGGSGGSGTGTGTGTNPPVVLPPTGGTTTPPTSGSGGGTTTPPKGPNPNNPWSQVNTSAPKKEMGMNELLMFGLIAGGIYMAYKKRQKA